MFNYKDDIKITKRQLTKIKKGLLDYCDDYNKNIIRLSKKYICEIYNYYNIVNDNSLYSITYMLLIYDLDNDKFNKDDAIVRITNDNDIYGLMQDIDYHLDKFIKY